MQKAREWGFKISDQMRICRSAEEIDAYIAHWDEARRELPFPTDGVVIKVNDFGVRRQKQEIQQRKQETRRRKLKTQQ